MANLKPIQVWNRDKQTLEAEKVYGGAALRFLYGTRFGKILVELFLRYSPFSQIYGALQKTAQSRRKVLPFIEEYEVDSSEFSKKPEDFVSFNDFFIRTLKPEARPIPADPNLAIMPADGRYSCYQHARDACDLLVKGQRLPLEELLQNQKLAQQYQDGALVLARLCPSDYHRFHFPCDGTVGSPSLINGYLYSVNPWALSYNVRVLGQNKRYLSTLKSPEFGSILCLEIGATSVGSVVYTYSKDAIQQKGNEKGYFEFGASALILIFPPNTIQIAPELLEKTQEGYEVRGLLGQELGKKYGKMH